MRMRLRVSLRRRATSVKRGLSVQRKRGLLPFVSLLQYLGIALVSYRGEAASHGVGGDGGCGDDAHAYITDQSQVELPFWGESPIHCFLGGQHCSTLHTLGHTRRCQNALAD